MSSGNVSSNSLWADVMVPCLSAVLRLLWWAAGSVCFPILFLSISPTGHLLSGFGVPRRPVPPLSCLVGTRLHLGGDCPSEVFCAAPTVTEQRTSRSRPRAEATLSKQIDLKGDSYVCDLNRLVTWRSSHTCRSTLWIVLQKVWKKFLTFVLFLFLVVKNYDSVVTQKMENIGLHQVIRNLNLRWQGGLWGHGSNTVGRVALFTAWWKGGLLNGMKDEFCSGRPVAVTRRWPLTIHPWLTSKDQQIT